MISEFICSIVQFAMSHFPHVPGSLLNTTAYCLLPNACFVQPFLQYLCPVEGKS